MCSITPMLPVPSIGMSPSMAPSTVFTSTRRTRRTLTRTQGATSNYKNLPDQECEPAGHSIGRSRGGLTTKIHHAVDGRGRPLAVVITGGQRHDGVILPQVLADLRIPRAGGGRARARPDAVLADRAYGSRGNRDYLRLRGIRAVIPEKKDQIATRKKRGSKGGRPRHSMPLLIRTATWWSVRLPTSSNGEGWRPNTTNSRSPIERPS